MSHGKAQTLGIFGIILIVLSIAFASLPLIPNNTLGVIRLIARQRTIEQQIVKDVLILDRPAGNYIQAISELQNSLPAWEQVQIGLQKGDDSLGISPNLPADIKLLILQSLSDFASIDTAARKILAHPSPVDQIQLTIILQHEHGYSLTMFQVSGLFEDHIHGISQIYFGIGTAISIGLLIIWICLFRALLKRIPKEEKQP
ncbi:MAG TPA: hypothetical protein VHV10_02865 [Ktedonobacteraceae bacterium]|jgi:hypothetical protein|nr:hypothetical protein [Ktedonobacteraceae bacterium]